MRRKPQLPWWTMKTQISLLGLHFLLVYTDMYAQNKWPVKFQDIRGRFKVRICYTEGCLHVLDIKYPFYLISTWDNLPNYVKYGEILSIWSEPWHLHTRRLSLAQKSWRANTLLVEKKSKLRSSIFYRVFIWNLIFSFNTKNMEWVKSSLLELKNIYN